jgi:hypothetical protein
MEAKPAGASDRHSVRLYACRYPKRTVHGKVENGERHIRQYDKLCFFSPKRGLPKTESQQLVAMRALRYAALNIRHGNRPP